MHQVTDLAAPSVERLELDDTSWVDVARGWLPPEHAADLFEGLRDDVRWQQGRVFRYDHWYEEPRLGGWWAPGNPPPHPLVVDLHRVVQRTWRKQFDGVAFAWYRDGRDSVAFHADRELKWLDDTVIAVLTLGAPRPWLLKPKSVKFNDDDMAPGVTRDLRPAGGDLFVMGGRTQADWVHAVPKVPNLRDGRISLQWRWTSRRGRQELGGSYRKPRRYGSGSGRA
jgi:alkylated DNA repair dioxygenase AlkB